MSVAAHPYHNVLGGDGRVRNQTRGVPVTIPSVLEATQNLLLPRQQKVVNQWLKDELYVKVLSWMLEHCMIANNVRIQRQELQDIDFV